jgi:hypothetical protein
MFRNVSYIYMHPSTVVLTMFDSFTDSDTTLVSNHTSDSGDTWVFGLNQNAGSTAKIYSNVLTKDNDASANAAVYYLTGETLNNDYYVQAKIKMMSSVSSGAAIVARINTASDNYYWLRHNRDQNRWELRVTVNGTASTLNSGSALYSDTMNAGDERVAKLEVIGTSIKAYIDGIERISATDSSHSSGQPGIRFNGIQSQTTGYSIDDFTVVNL